MALIDDIESKDNDAHLITTGSLTLVHTSMEATAPITDVCDTGLLVPLKELAASLSMFEESVAIKSRVKPDHFFDLTSIFSL